jgi:predicted MFS family arabinose efflux permease
MGLTMFKDRAILQLAVGQTLVWAGLFYVFPALLLRWEQDLGWSKTDLTGAITLAILVAALISPFTGRIIDQGRGPLLMAVSALVGGGAMMSLGSIDTLWQFYAVWIILGLAMAGCLYEPCFALVTRTRGKDAKRSIIFITLVAGFAGTISFPAMHSLSQWMGWRFATTMAGLMVVLLVVPLLWFGAKRLEDTRSANQPIQNSPDKTDRAFLRRPAFWFLATGLALLGVVHATTLQHLLPILNERGLSNEMAVLAASFLGPMQVAGRLAMMASEKYTSHHGVTIAAFAFMGLSVLLLLLSGSSPAFLSAFVILFGGAAGTVSILRPLLTRDVLGEQDFGSKSGALALPYLVGSATAPYLGSVIWAAAGYNTLLLFLAALTGIGCMLYVLAHRMSSGGVD